MTENQNKLDQKDLNAYGNEFKTLLGLKGSAVAVKLVEPGKESDIPAGMNKIDRQMRHCQMTDYVRRTGESFSTTYDDHQCKGGAAALGLGVLPDKVRSGQFYCDGLHHFKTVESAKKTVDLITFLGPNTRISALYAPLESVNYNPDVVIFICNPKQAMLLTQGYEYRDGGRIEAAFSGKQSVCSDAVAHVMKTNKPNMTIGCSGSRSYTKITDDELLFSIPAKDVEKTVIGLRSIVGENKN
ncbi:DUF169 domain-containing protein [Methanolapillus millepedarum]|uniref:DUF169 domain-containing protein n=1 Tax=Methanolapillus millepedarum TaxID=3028296 RepID=A0AA96V3E6_9EURY|nr:hypothetical protein MsAc7_02440 [Methanosarcinaceae archaeon Ac7]